MTKFVITVSLCLIFLVPSINSDGLSVLPNPIVEETEELAFQKLSEMETNMKHGLESVIKQVLPYMIRGSSAIDLSPQCMSSMLKLLTGLKDMKMWAFRMLDSNGIPIGGFLKGTGAAIGSYSQCIDIEIPNSHSSQVEQTGRFCVARIRPPLPPRPKKLESFQSVYYRPNSTFKTELMNELAEMSFLLYDVPLKVGLCVPSACSKDEINDLLQTISTQIGLYSDIEFCVVKEPISLDTVQISIISLYVAILLINILATMWDELSNNKDKKKNGNLQKIIQFFSIRRNIVSMVSTKPAVNRSLDCMNGMRFISITWVLLGHSYFIFERNLIRETYMYKEMIGDFFLQPVINGYFSVETFFFITSVLVAYNLVRRVDSGKKFPIIMVIVQRILRLLPSLLLVMSIPIILPPFGSGPFFKELMTDQANMCRMNWWKSALFFSNFEEGLQNCLPHGWYVSAEFQLFIVSMVYFLLLFRNRNMGNLFLMLMIVSCTLASGIITYVYDFPPTVVVRNLPDIKSLNFFAQNSYTTFYVHLGVYAVGLYLGTFLARNPKINISTVKAWIGWPVAFAVAISLVYATYPWNNGVDYSKLESILYAAFQRTMWGLCMAWVALACYAGKGGVITSFLSWPAFQPFVRLTYLVYLIHWIIYMYISSSKLGPVDVTHCANLFFFFGCLCSSLIIAFVIRILFEAPVSQIVALVLQTDRSRSSDSNDKKHDVNFKENTNC